MKAFQRVINSLLVLCLMFSLVPVSAAATQEQTTLDTQGMTIQSENTLGDLIADGVTASQEAEISAMEEYSGAFSVMDLTFSGATATVEYSAVEAATLMVAVYTEDGRTLLTSAHTAVAAGNGEASVTVPDLPDYFFAAAYLMDTFDMSPLCPSYSTPMYTRSMQELKESTTADYDPERVLNLDGDSTTNFMVYNQQTNVVEQTSGVNTVISANSDTMTYVFGNANEQITALEAGEILVYEQDNGELIIAKVDTIEVDGTTATIQGMEMEIEEVFSHIKIETLSDTGDVIVDESTMDSGVTFEGTGGPATYSDSGSGSTSTSMNYSIFKRLDNNKGAKVDFEARINIGLEVSFDYYSTNDHQFTDYKVDARTKIGLAISGELEMAAELGDWGIPVCPGVTIGMKPSIVVKVNGELTWSAVSNITTGFTYNKERGSTAFGTCEGVDMELDCNVTIFYGLDFKPNIQVLKGLVLEVEGSIPFGIELAQKEKEKEENPPENPPVRHSCEKCYGFDVNFLVGASIEAVFIKILKYNWNIVEYRRKVDEVYYSDDHDELGKGVCPYEEYRVSVQVLDHAGDSVSGAAVTISGGEESKNGTTNANGIYSEYLPEGKYTFRAEQEELNRAVNASVKEARTVKISLPEPPEPDEPTEPEETLPPEEEEKPGFAGGILGEITSTPVVNMGKPYRTGIFKLSDDFWWEHYYTSTDWQNDNTLVIYGSGELTQEIFDSGVSYSYWEDLDGVIYEEELEMPTYLKKIILKEGITGFDTIFNHSEYDNAGQGLYVTEISLPSTVTDIPDDAFNDSFVSKIEIPGKVTRIGDRAFWRTRLQEIDIPDTVTYIGEEAFAHCSSLQRVTIPDSVTEIGDYAFLSCSSLEELTIPGTVTKFGAQAFSMCRSMKRLTVEEGITVLGNSSDLYDTGRSLFAYNSALTTVKLPKSLRRIGDSAFYGCTSLKTITIPENVQEIGMNAFSGTGLTSITIPAGVKSLSYGTFQDCTNLRKVTLGKNLEAIEHGAFENCTALTSITMPEEISSIGSEAFAGCTALSEVSFASDTIYLFEGAFQDCTSLKKIEFPIHVGHLTGNAFKGCTGLEEIIFSGPVYALENEIYYDEVTGAYDPEGTYAEIFAGVSATAYYPWEFSLYNEDAIPYDQYTTEKMTNIGSQLTWIPYTLDEEGNMIPDVSKAFCANPTKETGDTVDTDAMDSLLPTEPLETEPVETEPVETEPAETEPAETEPTETKPVETEPAETEPAETEPVETESVETEPVESISTETEPVETTDETAQTQICSDEPHMTLEEAAAAKVPSSASAVTPETIPAAQPADLAPAEQTYTGPEITPEMLERMLAEKPKPPEMPAERPQLPEVSTQQSGVVHTPSSNAIFGGEYGVEEMETYTLKTASFSGLVPGQEYILLALTSLDTADPLSISNLIHIDQGTASSSGKLKFEYVERQEFGVSYVMACGASNRSLEDAEITFPGCYYDGTEQIVTPVVKYEGKKLKEGLDYTVSGQVAFTEKGEYTLYIRGIYNYSGLVKCTYTVTEKPLPTITITGDDTLETGDYVFLSATTSQWIDGEYEILWSVSEEDRPYVTLMPNEDSLTIKAGYVPEDRTITVTASIPGKAQDGTFQLTILAGEPLPPAKTLELYKSYYMDDGNGGYTEYKQKVSGETILYWLNEWMQDGFGDSLTAEITPAEAWQGVTWTTSDPEIATVEDDGYVSFSGKPGTVVITATTQDGTNLSQSVTYKILEENAVILPGVKPEGETDLHLLAGKSHTFKIRNTDTGKYFSAKDIVWRMEAEDGQDPTAVAKLKSGKLTAQKVVTKADLTVYADVYSKDTYLDTVEYRVTIYPAVTHVKLYEDGTEFSDKTMFFNLADTTQKTISVKVFPEDVQDVPVKWTISDAKKITDTAAGKYASYEIDGNTVTISSPTGKTGSITLKATTDEGSKKSASVKVQFGTFAKSVEISAPGNTIREKEKLQLTAGTDPVAPDKSGVTWSLSKADKAYASINSKGLLTAKTVYDEKTVTVIATSKDKMASAEFPVTIKPASDGLLILTHKGLNVTKGTAYVDWNKEDTVTLTAESFGGENAPAVTWKYPKNVEILEETDSVLTFRLAKAGSVTITATGADKQKATVKVAAAPMAEKVVISEKKTGNTDLELASGKSISLQADVINAKNKKVTWSITKGEAYAKISSSGKLTANKNITSEQTVTVMAAAQDGSGEVATLDVTIRPIAQGVQVYSLVDGIQTFRLDSNSSWWVRSNTTFEWDMAADPNLELAANVYPYNTDQDELNAIQGVTWKSSSTKVATIDENGHITCQKAGTTTITATAKDGSGKKISFKLTVVKKMKGLSIADQQVIGGKSLSLSKLVEFTPVDVTNKNLYWQIISTTYPDSKKVSIDPKKGTLKTPKVEKAETVTIRITSQDGTNLTTTCTVTINPKS